MTSEDDTITIYIIDTSSLIEMKRKYPEDVFPTLWQRIDDLIREDRLIAPAEVKEEIERVSDDLKKWADGRKKIFIDPLTQVEEVKKILKNFPSLAEPEKMGPNADPWLIALAIKKKGDKTL